MAAIGKLCSMSFLQLGNLQPGVWMGIAGMGVVPSSFAKRSFVASEPRLRIGSI